MLPILIINQRRKKHNLKALLPQKINKLNSRHNLTKNQTALNKRTNRRQEHNQPIKNHKRCQMPIKKMKLYQKQNLQEQAFLDTLSKSQSQLLCNLTQRGNQKSLMV